MRYKILIVDDAFINRELLKEILRDDYDVVKAAVSNKGIIVKYASLRLRDNEEIAKIAVSQNKVAFHYLSERMKNDEEVKKLIE